MRHSPLVSVSVVSHEQGDLVRELLTNLAAHVRTPHEVIVTVNVPEETYFEDVAPSTTLKLLRNLVPRGFGANHNAAFAHAEGDFFCVLNPDVRLADDPYPGLIACLRNPKVGVAAPLVRSPDGVLEDSARRFPTPKIIAAKLLKQSLPLDYPTEEPVIHPDWVAGLFMLFRRKVFEAVGGFDEGFFLYYEDVDLCARLRLAGLHTAQVTGISVVHAAQRRSHSNFRHASWHIQSMLRFFLKARRMRLYESVRTS